MGVVSVTGALLNCVSKLDTQSCTQCTLEAVPQINATAACLLGLLQLGPAPGQAGYGDSDPAMTGSELWRAAATSIARFWNLTRSQVFLELPRLQTSGLVESAPPRPRRRQPYRITLAGRAAFKEWLDDFVRAGLAEEQLRSPLVLSVFFGEFVATGELHSALTRARNQHQQRLAALEAMQRALGGVSRLPARTVDRGVEYQRLTISWIEGVLADLKT
jgi:DNA-binding PadR family transcriptional regulator